MVILLSDNILEYIMKKGYINEIFAIMTILVIITIIVLVSLNYNEIAEKFNNDKKYT